MHIYLVYMKILYQIDSCLKNKAVLLNVTRHIIFVLAENTSVSSDSIMQMKKISLDQVIAK